VITIAVVAAVATIVAVGALHAMASGGPRDPEPTHAASAQEPSSAPQQPASVPTTPATVAPSPVESMPETPPADVVPVKPPARVPLVSPASRPAQAPVFVSPAAPSPNVVEQPAVAPVQPRPAQQAPVDLRPDPAGGTLIAQASHALADGETPRALALAHQAVLANPSDADAWLILGAACQAAGNVPAARDAYRSCVSSARTANISECRLLAGQ
jgi:hypothetical protein